ncbi:MAG TPA: RHS repeat-associated core domain-containing protein [Terriglobia bacterium]|nr:RHS repeat-associated core domain-containing protein [Terriglobia bacterium]
MNLNDSTEGRWLTPDPLGGDITNPQSLNRYAYALNNPTTLTDPLGLQAGACSGYSDWGLCAPLHPALRPGQSPLPPFVTPIIVSQPLPPQSPYDCNGGEQMLGNAFQFSTYNSGACNSATPPANTPPAPKPTPPANGPAGVMSTGCYAGYANSSIGKVTNFLDPFANLKDAFLGATAKFGGLKGLNAVAKGSPDLEVLSVTQVGSKTVVPSTLETLTGGSLNFLKSAGPYLSVASGASALADLTVYSTCYSLEHGLPPSSPAFWGLSLYVMRNKERVRGCHHDACPSRRYDAPIRCRFLSFAAEPDYLDLGTRAVR